MVKRFVALVLLIISSTANGQSALEDRLGFFVGKWRLITSDITPSGLQQKGVAVTNCYFILDRKALQDDFYQLNAAGDTIFSGTSIRSYNEQDKRFQIVWVMPGVTGITDIQANWKNGELQATGKGYDSMGTFLERFKYYKIKPDSYQFSMDRSYDNGLTWISPFSAFSAERVRQGGESH